MHELRVPPLKLCPFMHKQIKTELTWDIGEKNFALQRLLARGQNCYRILVTETCLQDQLAI